MRLFIAVELSEEMKNALRRAQDELCDHGVRGRFTPAENMHLTLAFIGDYPDPEAVLDALSAVSFTPFEIELEGLGCFGDLWWAGLKDSAALESTARRVRRALAERGIPFDRKKFNPHITLVRKPEVPKGLPEGPVPVEVPGAEMTVERISLMRSDRGKNGMIYTEL